MMPPSSPTPTAFWLPAAACIATPQAAVLASKSTGQLDTIIFERERCALNALSAFKLPFGSDDPIDPLCVSPMKPAQVYHGEYSGELPAVLVTPVAVPIPFNDRGNMRFDSTPVPCALAGPAFATHEQMVAYKNSDENCNLNVKWTDHMVLDAAFPSTKQPYAAGAAASSAAVGLQQPSGPSAASTTHTMPATQRRCCNRQSRLMISRVSRRMSIASCFLDCRSEMQTGHRWFEVAGSWHRCFRLTS